MFLGEGLGLRVVGKVEEFRGGVGGGWMVYGIREGVIGFLSEGGFRERLGVKVGL